MVKERKNITMIKIKDVLDVVLEDDETPYGGTEFLGETVKDFLNYTELTGMDSIDELNTALKECGIKPLTI